MFYFKIGIRNIIKNIRKTALTLLTVVFGMTALLLYNGSNSFLFKTYAENEIRHTYGHFQIYLKGYNQFGKDSPFEYLIPDWKPAATEFSKIKGVSFVSPRLSFSGIISSDKKSAIAFGYGGLPEFEKKIAFSGTNNGLSEGSYITGLDNMIAGYGLMRKFDGKIGDHYTLMGTMKGGGINGVDVTPVGIQKGMSEFDQYNKMFIFLPIESVESLMMVDNAADSMIVMLSKTQDIPSVEPQIQALCNRLGLEYRRWDSLAVYYKSVKAMFDMNMLILTIIILAILVFIIANTTHMNLMERIREIGTIRAVGTTRFQLVKIFLAESALIGTIGSFAGIILGFLIAAGFNTAGGIYHPPSGVNTEGYYTLIHPQIASAVMYWLLLVLVSVTAAAWTASKASRMAIADALRWN